MSNLEGQVGELRMQIEVKRADTGKVEKYELVGFIDKDKFKEFVNGRDQPDAGHLDS